MALTRRSKSWFGIEHSVKQVKKNDSFHFEASLHELSLSALNQGDLYVTQGQIFRRPLHRHAHCGIGTVHQMG